jgi:hypothetical protein
MLQAPSSNSPATERKTVTYRPDSYIYGRQGDSVRSFAYFIEGAVSLAGKKPGNDSVGSGFDELTVRNGGNAWGAPVLVSP